MKKPTYEELLTEILDLRLACTNYKDKIRSLEKELEDAYDLLWYDLEDDDDYDDMFEE